MTRKIINKIRSLSFLLAFFLVSCSKDLSKLPPHQQAIYQPGRPSNDIPRDEYRKPNEVLPFIDLKNGQTVVDLLGGSGYYTELFSFMVGPEGAVYIQNNSLFERFSGDQLRERLANNRLANVRAIKSEYANLELPNNVDVIFVGLSLHDFFVERDDPVISANPNAFYTQAYRALKPGGILIVIDHAAEPGTQDSMTTSLHRIDENFIKQQLEQNGFSLIDTLDILRNPQDDYSKDIWDSKVYHRTDRFIHKYQKQPLKKGTNNG